MTLLAHRHPTRCLGGEEISEYVERALPGAELLQWDRHLVACGTCRGAVQDERRMMAALRGREPSLPGELHAALLSLASLAPSPPSSPRLSHHTLRAPGESGHAVPVRVLSPSAPACHRSALRSAVFATLAAGASAAAAWSLAVAGAAPSAPGGVQGGSQAGRPPQQVARGGARSGSAVPAAALVGGSMLGRGTSAVSTVLVAPNGSTQLPHGAESMP